MLSWTSSAWAERTQAARLVSSWPATQSRPMSARGSHTEANASRISRVARAVARLSTAIRVRYTSAAGASPCKKRRPHHAIVQGRAACKTKPRPLPINGRWMRNSRKACLIILRGFCPCLGYITKPLHPPVQAPRFQIGIRRAPKTEVDQGTGMAFGQKFRIVGGQGQDLRRPIFPGFFERTLAQVIDAVRVHREEQR